MIDPIVCYSKANRKIWVMNFHLIFLNVPWVMFWYFARSSGHNAGSKSSITRKEKSFSPVPFHKCMLLFKTRKNHVRLNKNNPPFGICCTFLVFGLPLSKQCKKKTNNNPKPCMSIIKNRRSDTLAFTRAQYTLCSGVPGDKLLIFDPSWTNMRVMAAILEWRALYSSYSEQKSSL